MRETLKAIRDELRKKMHEPVSAVGKWLGRVVRGYFNYHAVPGNLYRLGKMRQEICGMWRKTLKRRSQWHKLPWDRVRPCLSGCHPHPLDVVVRDFAA